MNNNASLKTRVVAFVALLVTLGFILAGFVWLHVEPSKRGVTHAARASLAETVGQLQAQVNQQQQILLDIQARVHKLELFDAQIKVLH